METLQKIPIEALYKLERVENGKLKSYIDELEHRVSEFNEITQAERTHLKKVKYQVELKEENSKLRRKIKDVLKENNRLYSKLAKETKK